MIMRIVLFLGVGLILLSLGAMGWQYWQGLPVTAAQFAETGAPSDPTASAGPVAQEPAPPQQSWLISPGGGLVARDMARAYLRQDGFAEGRVVRAQFRAPLAALLSEGETLPDEAYREVFADIRAPALSRGFCAELTAGWAGDCAVDRARVVEGSYDPSTGTAEFAVTLAFAEVPRGALPDLTTQALFSDYGTLDPALARADTPEALLALAAEAAARDCAARAPEPALCRVMGLSLDWKGPQEARANWRIAWLAPLPKGMYPAPPLY
jgi:hypothetical protein